MVTTARTDKSASGAASAPATIRHPIRRNLAAIALIALVLAGLIGHGRTIVGAYINADTLYTAALYQDLFVDQYEIRDWNLTPAASFFPDMLLMFPLLWATGDLGHAYVGYTIVQYMLMLLAFVGVARLYTRNLPDATIAIFTAGAFLLALLQQGNYVLLASAVLSISHHASVFVVGTILLWITLRAAQRGYSLTATILFVLIAIPTVFSDMLLLPWFLVPLTLTALFFSLLGWFPVRFFVVTAILAAISYAAGVAGIYVCQALDFFRWNPAVADLTLETVVRALTTPKVLRGYLGLGPAFPALMIAMVAWLPLVVILYVRDARSAGVAGDPGQREQARLALFLVTFALLSMGASVLGPLAKARNVFWVLRYFLPLVLLPPFVLAILIAMYRGAFARYVKSGTCWAIVGFALYAFVPDLRALHLAQLRTPYPDTIQCLDEILSERGLTYGYCGYWDSKYLTLLSHSGARFNLVSREVTPWHMTNNPAWYHTAPGGEGHGYPRYAFAVAVEQWASTLRERFGAPSAEHRCGDRVVLVYDRPDDVAFRNRIRIPATLGDGPQVDASGSQIRGTTAMPPLPGQDDDLNTSGIVCAPQHHRYMVDGTPPDDPGLLPIPAGETLAATFDPPILADVLEVAVADGPAYVATFYLANQQLGTLDIPAVPGDATRIRYLRLPGTVRPGFFDRITIAVRGSGSASVGHLCFYADEPPARHR
jgi:hypothetical protein